MVRAFPLPLRRAIGPALLIGAFLLALAGCSHRSGPTSPPVLSHTWLGLVPSAAAGSPADSFASVFFTVRATGVNMLSYGVRWSDFESAPGRFDTSTPRQLAALTAAYDMGLYVTLHVIETNQRSMPADLAGLAFGDSGLLQRLDRAVDTLAAAVKGGPLIAFSLGNEVDVYFGAHPGELEDFKQLVAREVARLHARLPSVPVGVVTTSPPGNAHAAVGDALNAYADVGIYTYYPFVSGSDFQHRPTTTLDTDLDAMRARLGGKPIGLQEIGYSSSPANGSGEAQQADFVRRFRAYVAGSLRRDVLFAEWYLYTDMDSATVDTLLGFYGYASPGFRAYLGNLGLRRSDGTPKLAWNAWRGLP
jgi:hypothetical protein